jgi:hypothetical protein
MKNNWPTLEGRLSHPLTTEEEALLQLEKVEGITLSDYAIKKLEKIKKRKKKASMM